MVEVRVRNHTDQVHNEAMRKKEENDQNLSHNTNVNTKPTPPNPRYSPINNVQSEQSPKSYGAPNIFEF